MHFPLVLLNRLNKTESAVSLYCRLSLVLKDPFFPDYLSSQCDGYRNRGPNILKMCAFDDPIAGSEHLIPVICVQYEILE